MTKDEALRLALDTLKEVREETFRLMRNGERLYSEDKVWSTIISIQESLEAKDEPVAWMSEDEHTVYTSKQVDGCFQHDHIPLYTSPQRTWVGLTDEPVAWGMETDGVILDVICPDEHEREEGEYNIPLYTTPQRTWVGLTVDEIAELVCNLEDPENRIELGQKIEAKLKKKNNPPKKKDIKD